MKYEGLFSVDSAEKKIQDKVQDVDQDGDQDGDRDRDPFTVA